MVQCSGNSFCCVGEAFAVRKCTICCRLPRRVDLACVFVWNWKRVCWRLCVFVWHYKRIKARSQPRLQTEAFPSVCQISWCDANFRPSRVSLLHSHVSKNRSLLFPSSSWELPPSPAHCCRRLKLCPVISSCGILCCCTDSFFQPHILCWLVVSLKSGHQCRRTRCLPTDVKQQQQKGS